MDAVFLFSILLRFYTIFLAYPGDPITICFIFPADKPRAHTFTVHAHKFLKNKKDIFSSIISSKSARNVGSNDYFNLFYGVGGRSQQTGDYLYRSGNIRWDIENSFRNIIICR